MAVVIVDVEEKSNLLRRAYIEISRLIIFADYRLKQSVHRELDQLEAKADQLSIDELREQLKLIYLQLKGGIEMHCN